MRLLDGVTSGLIGMAGQFAAFNRHVEGSKANLTALEGQLKRLKMTGVVGGLAAGAGVAGLSLFSAPLRAAREYELAFTKFKTLNLGDAVNRQADQFARSADVMGVSATQLMKTMSESVGIFGSYAEAQAIVPKIAALNAANSAIFGGKIGEIDEGATRSLMLFMDRRGLTRNSAGYDRGLDLAERLVTGSGGFIQFKDLATFSQRAGTAFRALSDQGLMQMAGLMQEQGGSAAGVALMSAYQNWVAGRTPMKTMEYMERLGLGHIHQIMSGTVGGKRSTTNVFDLMPAYERAFENAPVQFMQNVVLPLLAKRGITDQNDVLKAVNMMFSNRTGSNQESIMATQQLQLMRDFKLVQNAMGAAQVIGQYRQDPNQRWGDLMTKYKNMLIELGETVLPLATRAVGDLTDMIKAATRFAREFPALTRGITVGTAVLSGLVAAGGAITLATAGFKALGIALTVGKAGSIGALIAEAALAISGPGGLVLGIGALLTAAAGATWWLEKYGPVQHKNDGQAHPNEHWVPGQGRSGAGGSWEDNMRWVGPARKRHQEYWNPDSSSWSTSPYVAPQAPKVIYAAPVILNLDGKKIAESTVRFISKVSAGPQTGISGFDGSQSLAPAGGIGGP